MNLRTCIGCNVRTVWNNLQVLAGIYIYLIFKNTSMGLLMLYSMIMKTTTFLPIREAVVFLSCPKELMSRLNSIDSLVSLRIFIRELLSLDSPDIKGVASVDYKNIRDIQKYPSSLLQTFNY